MYRTTGLEIGDRTTVRDVGKWRFRPLVLEIHLASLAVALLKERGYMEGWGKKTATTFFSFMPRFSEFCDCFCCYLVGGGRGEAESPNSFMLQRSSIIVKCPNED